MPVSWCSRWSPAACSPGRALQRPAVERVPPDPFARTFVYYFALAPAFVATLLAVAARSSDAGRRRRPDRRALRPRGDCRGGRHDPALSPAHQRAGLARAARGAAGRDRRRDRYAAVDRRGRSRSEQARECDGPVLHRDVPPSHRPAARNRRSATCAVRGWSRWRRRTGRASPSTVRRALSPWISDRGYPRRGARSWCGPRPIRPARRRQPSRQRFPDMVAGGAAARFRARCRAGCRCCASAGR